MHINMDDVLSGLYFSECNSHLGLSQVTMASLGFYLCDSR